MESTQTLHPQTRELAPLTAADRQLIGKLAELPEGYWDFKEEDTRQYTHGLHNYPAMMVCPISRNIISIMRTVRPVESLLDPFAGSGTVLVEAKLAGLQAADGNDINPLALLLTKVKTTNLDLPALRRACQKLKDDTTLFYQAHSAFFDGVNDYMERTLKLDLTSRKGWGEDAPRYLEQYCRESQMAFRCPSFKNLGYWFKPQVVLLLQLIKEHIEAIEEPAIRDFVYVAFSESIRLVSNRRNGEFKMFRMPAAKVASFTPDVQKEFFSILDRNIEKMRAFNEACPAPATKITIYQNDAARLNDVPDNAYDLIITSPPYGDSRTTVAYGEYSRLSLQWIGLYGLTEKDIMGIDRSLMGGRKYRSGFAYSLSSPTLEKALEEIRASDLERAGDVYSFYDDLEHSVAATAQKMKSGGYAFWVVGNRTVKNVLLQTDVILSEMAAHYGLRPIYTVDRNIPNKVMPSLNSPTNEAGKKAATMVNEHIVVLRK